MRVVEGCGSGINQELALRSAGESCDAMSIKHGSVRGGWNRASPSLVSHALAAYST